MADEGPLPPPPHDPERVRDATDALLAEDHFRDGMGLGYDERTRGFLEHLEQRLAWLIEQITALRETHPLVYWTLLIVLGVVAALLVAHIAYTVRRGSRAPEAAGRTVGELIREQTLETLRRRVAEAEAEGAWARALRLRFALAAAEVVGLPRLRTLGHLTYRELVAAVAERTVAGPGSGGGALGEVLVVVEDTTYGGRELDQARYRECVARLGSGAGGPPGRGEGMP